jgi:hypothetical protein
LYINKTEKKIERKAETRRGKAKEKKKLRSRKGFKQTRTRAREEQELVGAKIKR